MPGLNSQVGARSALFKSSRHCVVLSSFCCYCVVLLFVLFCFIVLFYVLIVCTVTLPPGVNPIAVDKYIYNYTITQNTVTKSYSHLCHLEAPQ